MNFAHDGLHDALTRLAAPPYFYESLRREIALASRSGADLSAIRLILDADSPIYDATIISFADLISTAFRFEDIKARLAVYEFGILIHGGEELASQLSKRLVARWAIEGTPNSFISYAYTRYMEGEDALAFINRLDDQRLIRNDF
jgi:GGDEF domain-containing protein